MAESNMTPKDKEKFERIWKKLAEKFKLSSASVKITDEMKFSDWIEDTVMEQSVRIQRLEVLVYFLIEALAGEGWFTNELKESIRRFGLKDLFERS